MTKAELAADEIVARVAGARASYSFKQAAIESVKQIITKHLGDGGDTEQSRITLINWMDEVTSLLCYQPDIPKQHKQDLINATEKFRAAITAERKL